MTSILINVLVVGLCVFIAVTVMAIIRSRGDAERVVWNGKAERDAAYTMRQVAIDEERERDVKRWLGAKREGDE